MPYLECPGCRLSLYSAASHSWIADVCPVCATSLEGASKQFPSEVGARTLCREFPSTPGAIARARHALDGLYGELGERLHRTAELLVSELVSNSVRHSKATNGAIELVASVTPTVVRVEVSDDGEGFEPPPATSDDAESGRGLGLVRELGVEMMITLGALLADVPHTRPSPVTGSASDPELVRQLGLSSSRYEGPTGIVGVLHDACKRAEIPSASLWAAVPHYVSLTPSPRAAVALCERLGSLIGVEVDVDELEEAARSYEEQVSEAVASDEDTASYVEELERRVDELEEQTDLPSGDALAAELTRFLREREEDDDGGDAAREQ